MNDKEMINNLIDVYTMLLQIQAAQPPEIDNRELKYKIKVTKAKLEAFGIVTTDLEL